jgi:hypothetical protein
VEVEMKKKKGKERKRRENEDTKYTKKIHKKNTHGS